MSAIYAIIAMVIGLLMGIGIYHFFSKAIEKAVNAFRSDIGNVHARIANVEKIVSDTAKTASNAAEKAKAVVEDPLPPLK